MKNLNIEPSHLEDYALKIENAHLDAVRLQSKLNEKINYLSNNFESKDNKMFTKQLLDNVSIINDVCDRMNSYARYLRIHAKMYRELQESKLNEANNLLKERTDGTY